MKSFYTEMSRFFDINLSINPSERLSKKERIASGLTGFCPIVARRGGIWPKEDIFWLSDDTDFPRDFFPSCLCEAAAGLCSLFFFHICRA